MNISWLGSLLQGISLVAFAPLFLGWLNWWKARLTGRRRPLTWIVQPYRDWFKLLRLPPTHPQTASWLFRITPYLVFVVYGCLLFSIPLWTSSLVPPDLLLTMYLLGLGRFSLSLAGLDSASSFGNLGSSREMFFHFLTEISLFPAIAAFWLWVNVPLGKNPLDNLLLYMLLWLATPSILVTFFLVLLLEARRLPVDNPETHLELTMAGKAVELEFSGRDLALVEWGETNKLLFLLAWWSQWLFSLIFSKAGALSSVAIPLLHLTLWLLAGAGLAFWEWGRAKLRLGWVPHVAQTSLVLSLFALLLRLIAGG